jgi:pectinesterase
MRKGSIIILIALFIIGLMAWFDCNPIQKSADSTAANYDVLGTTDAVRSCLTVGSGGYSTIAAAISAAASGDTINIMNGTYKEKLKISKKVHLVGQSNTGTIITYSDSAGSAGSTEKSSSVIITAAGFIAENIDFRNDFSWNGGSNQQDVAVSCEGDEQYFNNCQFHGHQDTLELWSGSGRQYFNNCTIVGHTDYIFGNGTALFNNCAITSLQKSGGSITAPSTSASSAYGIVFMNCTVSGAGTSYLGRPWHPNGNESSACTYFKCSLGSNILAAGWNSMSGVSPVGQRFYEYQNTGAGASSTRYTLPSSKVSGYTESNILNGWTP